MLPRISIVLPVFNGQRTIGRTLDSILDQTEEEFELIVVDDGSTDDTPEILTHYARRDSRIRVVTQHNAGITLALIHGCEAVRAPLIARHDCGDVSRPRRLERLLTLMDEHPTCILAASEVVLAGPEGEVLYTTTHAKKDVRASLLQAGYDEMISLPHHGAAVMRTAAYHQAGGYRREFYVAQDVDLWIRMATLGDVCVDDTVQYEARVDVRGISSLFRTDQILAVKVAVGLRGARNDAERTELLRELSAMHPRTRMPTRGLEAKALYFIASCLRQRRDTRWRKYALAALRRNPLHMSSWLLLVRGMAV